jgi:ketosteroid isomerase-like protein
VTGTETAFLPRYFAALDDGEEILQLFAPDFTFALLWSSDGEAREFAGGFDAWAGYMAQRQPDGQRHHISHLLREHNTELATGRTTRFDKPLGTFTFAVEPDDDGLIRRLFAARTEAFGGLPF